MAKWIATKREERAQAKAKSKKEKEKERNGGGGGGEGREKEEKKKKTMICIAGPVEFQYGPACPNNHLSRGAGIRTCYMKGGSGEKSFAPRDVNTAACARLREHEPPSGPDTPSPIGLLRPTPIESHSRE